jgi:hypothetical protein
MARNRTPNIVGKGIGLPAILPAHYAEDGHLSADFVLPICGKRESDTGILVAASRVRNNDIGGEVRSKKVPWMDSSYPPNSRLECTDQPCVKIFTSCTAELGCGVF